MEPMNVHSSSGVLFNSETMSDGTLERNRAEKALIITNKTPAHCQFFKNSGVKNYSDKNGNEVIKSDNKNRRTFAFWALVVLIFIFGLGNLALTCTMLFVIRLGKGKFFNMIFLFSKMFIIIYIYVF